MTSRASWLNPALIRENFKRFWPLMIGGLAFWLICGPIALAIEGRPYGYYFMKSILRHANPAPILLNLALPIALAVACFGYLHRTNAAGVMHSMPCSRRSLFVSNYVSGLLMSVLPVLVITLMLCLMKGGVELPAYDGITTGIAFTDLLRFFAEEFTVIAFVYSISVFAAVISGLPVIHALTAGALNFICPAIFLVLFEFMDIYEYGFTWSSLMEDYLVKMNPWLTVLLEDGLSAKQFALYLLIALAVTVLAFLLYKRRALERAGESYVFRAAKYIIGFLMVFVCSSLTGFVFQSEIGLASYLLGFVFGYVIAQMIVNKSTKIFTKECLLSGLVYLLIIAAIICVFKLDLVGYQKRVPNPAKVGSVEVYSDVFDLGLDGQMDEIRDPENIARITAFHKQIVADPANYQDTWLGHYTSSSWSYDSRDYEDALTRPVRFEVDYHLKNGLTMSRDYWVPAILLKNSADLRAVWNSSENKGMYDLLAQMEAANTSVVIEGYNLMEDGEVISNWTDFDTDHIAIGSVRAAEKDELLKAIMADVSSIDYDRLFLSYDYVPYINIHLDCRTPVSPDEPEQYLSGNAWTYYDYDENGNPTYRHTVTDVNANSGYVNTMQALLRMDTSDDLKKAVEYILQYQ